MTDDVPPNAGSKRLPLSIALPLLLVLGMGSAIALYSLVPRLFQDGGAGGTGDPSGNSDLRGGKLEFVDLTDDPAGYDFGLILDGEHQTHTFTFQNQGDDPVTIRELNVPCDCTKVEEIGAYGSDGTALPAPATAKRDFVTLAPGQRGYLRLRVFPAGMARATEVRHSTLVLVTDSIAGTRVFLRYRATFKALINVAWRKVGVELLQAVRSRVVNVGFLTQTERATYHVDFIPISHQPFEFKEPPRIDGKPLDEAPDYMLLEVTDAVELGVPRKRLLLHLGGTKPLGIQAHSITAVAQVDGHEYAVETTFKMGIFEDVYLRTSAGERDRSPRLDFGDLEPLRQASMQREVQYAGTLTDFRFESARIEIEGEPIDAHVDLEALGGGRFLIDLLLPHGATRSFVGEVTLVGNQELPSGSKEFRLPVRGRVTKTAALPRERPRTGPARCKVDRPVRSIGTVWHRSRPEVAFPLENPGAAPLAILGVRSTQVATMELVAAIDAEGTKREPTGEPRPEHAPLLTLESGFRGELVFRVDTTPLPQERAEFEARASVRTNDPITPEVFLSARGIAQRPVHLYQAFEHAAQRPIDRVRLGNIGRTQRIDVALELHATVPAAPGFVRTITFANGEALPEDLLVETTYEAGDGLPIAHLSVRLRGERALGPWERTLRVDTNLVDDHPCEFGIEAVVIADLARVQDVLLEGAPDDATAPPPVISLPIPIDTVELGPLRKGTPFRHQERLWYLGREETFQIEERVTWKATEGSVPEDLELAVAPPDASHPFHRLQVNLPSGASEPFHVLAFVTTDADDLGGVEIPLHFATRNQ